MSILHAWKLSKAARNRAPMYVRRITSNHTLGAAPARGAMGQHLVSARSQPTRGAFLKHGDGDVWSRAWGYGTP